MQKQYIIGSVLVASLALSVGDASGAIANFSDGNDNTAPFAPGTNNPTVDSYRGAIGGGWASAWLSLSTTDTTAATATVVSASPLAGGGNYLSVSMTGGTTNLHRVSARRQFATTTTNGGFDASLDHTISWKFRFDEANLNSFTGGNDGLLFADKPDSSAGTGGTQTWAIKAQGDQLGKRFFAFNGDGLGNATRVDSGIELQPGVVYSMAVTVHPGTNWLSTTYDVTIDNGSTRATLTDLHFRNTGLYTSGGYLQFTAESYQPSRTRSFSLDSISVAVPEPASLGAMCFAGVLTLRRRSR